MTPDIPLAATEENLNNLEKVIDLVMESFKKSKSRDIYNLDINCLTNKTKIGSLGKKSVSLINDCLLSHRFEEAAKLMWVLCQDRSYCHAFLYKCMMIVFENLQIEDKNEAVIKFSSDIQDLESISKLDVQLEYMLYTIRNNISDAQDSYEKVTSKRLKSKIKKIPILEHLLNAYCSLIDYIAWCKSCQDNNLSTISKNLADKAISGFKNVLEYPGTWDIFVLKLIEMLEYYGNYEMIEDILKKYVHSNPQHVNAYIYLCVHLHKFSSDKTLFIEYSKKLYMLCPSDSRVLLLVHTWNEQGKKLKERLKILFMYLDYPANCEDKLGWKMLALHLSQASNSKKSSSMKTVISLWSFRSQAWNYMHFSLRDKDIDLELIDYKIKVISVLEKDHEYIKKTKYIYQTKIYNLDNNSFSNEYDQHVQEIYKVDDEIR